MYLGGCLLLLVTGFAWSLGLPIPSPSYNIHPLYGPNMCRSSTKTWFLDVSGVCFNNIQRNWIRSELIPADHSCRNNSVYNCQNWGGKKRELGCKQVCSCGEMLLRREATRSCEDLWRHFWNLLDLFELQRELGGTYHINKPYIYGPLFQAYNFFRILKFPWKL